ncbi:MAG: zinc-dependent metalloprotease [Pseudobdellovibrionaceae bacterium]|nr:MAG: zinc-dependent metalloprotease [Pseudobdellovibrionaceae bacterium]
MGKTQLVGAFFLFIVGCTKELPYQSVEDKFDDVSKSMIDTEVDYLYVPSTVNTTRTSAASRPYWMGDAKRVRFVFSEDALNVIEVEADDRFQANNLNAKPVLSIPIQHVDYRCREDAYGKCTHQEEQNSALTWEQRNFFKLEPAKLALKEINFLPVTLKNLFSSCYNEVDSQFSDADMKIDQDSLNIKIEKTFKTSIDCASDGLESLSDLTFKVQYHYSFAKLSALASKNYKPYEYTSVDERTFGFFSTKKRTLGVDNNDVIDGEKQYMDRWNPKRSVVYYLSSAFTDPKYENIKTATKSAIQTINAALVKAGAEIQIELRDHDSNVDPGDIRFNSIVLVEDPQASGVIGYGPHASNPMTGEIVHARTVMYLGTIKKYIKYTYNDIILERINEIKNAQNTQSLMASSSAVNHPQGDSSRTGPPSFKGWSSNKRDFVESNLDERKLKAVATDALSYKENKVDLKDRIEFLSRTSNYPAELFNFHHAIDGGIDEVIAKVGLKTWKDLSDDEQELVIERLLPHVWVPTLVHEFGHNLGLRHNFAGSEDKDNFYSARELSDYGFKSEFKYSSIMDYAYSSINELPILGKYDVAALRYAYKEEVQLKDEQYVSVEKWKAGDVGDIKGYQYCTDEHVGANPNCNRFDEGTSLVEIAAHYIKSYDKRYARAYMRNERRHFSLYQDASHAGSVYGQFMNLRMMFERYETVKNMFSLPDNSPVWEQYEFLKDLKQATLLSAKFFTEVIKTPNLTCAVVHQSAQNQVFSAPLQALSAQAVSCFDSENVQLAPGYSVIGQGGRWFQSKKDPNSINPYVDQIDVRGIWIDKLLATRFLLGTSFGNTTLDKYEDTYLQMPELKSEIADVVESVVLDRIQGVIHFATKEGEGFSLKGEYQLSVAHEIPEPLSESVSKFFGLPSGRVDFSSQVIRELKALGKSEKVSTEVRHLLRSLRVLRALPQDGRNLDEYIYVDTTTGVRYLALNEASIASKVIGGLKAGQILDATSEEDIQLAMAYLSGQEGVDGSGVSKAVLELGVDTLSRYQSGRWPSQDYFEVLLEAMAE